MKPSLLVSGGAGFIGSHVIRSILALNELADYGIVELDDLSGGFRENIPDDRRVEFVQGTVTDVGLITDLFQRRRFRYVYHLAAYAAEGLSHFIRRFNYTNNLIGSTNLINASVNYGTECFVFTSSIAVYGSGQAPMREDVAPRPEDPYGVAKYAVELDLAAAQSLFGLDHVIFRPHNVYGEHQNTGDKYRNVVGIFMNQVLLGRPMTIFGDGTQQRAFSYIGDVAPIIARSPLVPKACNRVFNVGAEKPYTVNELARRVAAAMGVTPDIVHVEARKEAWEAYCEHSACDEVFGRLGTTNLDEGLARMAAWVKAAGSRKSSDFEGIEISRGIPKAWLGGK